MKSSIKTAEGEKATLEFTRKRWALYIEMNCVGLQSALQMADFFTLHTKHANLTITVLQEKCNKINEECRLFLQYFEDNKNNLQDEFKTVLGREFSLTRCSEYINKDGEKVTVEQKDETKSYIHEKHEPSNNPSRTI